MQFNYLLVLTTVAALIASYTLGYTPLFIPVIYVILGSVTLLVYAKDKWASQRGAWRVPENTLHLLALFGGWPGALAAQQLFRHKTVKGSFRLLFWITVVANGAALSWLHAGSGARLLRAWAFDLETLVINGMGAGNTRSILLNLLGFH
ncbi:MAG: DUF1294 domain-containing protein [Pseudomonadota bacterium]